MQKNELNWDQFAGAVGARHPLPEQWLLFVDGELTASDRAIAQRHLEACWQCRAYVAELEATIADISRYDQVVLQPRHTPPSAQASDFARRLQQLRAVSTSTAPVWWKWLRGGISWRWLSPIAAAAAALLVWMFWVSNSPTVSAREVLERAAQAETQRLATLSRAVQQPVLHRRLNLRKAGHAQTAQWESWQDAAQRRAERLPEARAVVAELQTLLQANGLATAQLLSATSYRAWQNSVADAAVTLQPATLAAGAAGWRLTTKLPATRDGQLVQSDLLVRAADWQAVGQTFEFKAQPQNSIFELTEAAYEVVELASVDETVFSANATTTATPARLLSTPSPTGTPALAATLAPVVSAAALLSTEMECLRLLNLIHANLGEEVSVRRMTQTVLVEGTLETDARRQEIVQALEPLTRAGAVQLRLSTTGEVLARQPQTNTAPRVFQPDDATTSRQSFPLAEAVRRHLQAQGISAAELDAAVSQYAIRVVRRARQLNLHAWALRNLATRFTEAEVAALDATAQSKRRNLLHEHSAAWLREMAELRRELTPFLPAAQPEESALAAPKNEAELRRTILRLAELTAALQTQLGAAFTVSTDNSTPTIGTPAFRRTLAEAERLAAALDSAIR